MKTRVMYRCKDEGTERRKRKLEKGGERWEGGERERKEKERRYRKKKK